jgi:hypothetical protein
MGSRSALIGGRSTVPNAIVNVVQLSSHPYYDVNSTAYDGSVAQEQKNVKFSGMPNLARYSLAAASTTEGYE